jgi:c(7)-type cytochrome triheme protein
MLMCSTPRKTKRNKSRHLLLVLACGISFFGSKLSAQVYLPAPPPEQPSDYGKVILDTHSSTTGPGAVVFDHWLHRSKFTCRVCHVDIGFAMKAKATGISASTNREGFHCGVCHDGKVLFNGRTIFASCSGDANDKRCARCHSVGKKGVRTYEYKSFTKKFPKGVYGVNWEAAESSRAVKPVDFIEGLSVKKAPIQNRKDFSIKAGFSWVNPIVFSHEKHSIWNGCELCHPEIFPSAKRGTIHYSMFSNIDGRYCGACHGKVASPLNNCEKCHPRGPMWLP